MKQGVVSAGIIVFITGVTAFILYFYNSSNMKKQLTDATDTAIQTAMMDSIEAGIYEVTGEVVINEEHFYRTLVESINDQVKGDSQIEINILHFSKTPPLARVETTIYFLGQKIVYVNTYIIEKDVDSELIVSEEGEDEQWNN